MKQALPAHAIACESVYVPPCALGNDYQRIFVGTATEKLNTGEFRFSIEEPLKGITQDTKQINVGPGPCLIPYKIGTRYLMLLRDFQGPNGTFNLSYAEPVESAADSIDFFRKIARGGKLTVLKGRTTENASDSMVTFELDAELAVEADRLSWKGSSLPIEPIATRPKFSVAAGTDPVHLTFVVDAVNDISAKETPENMAAYNDREE